MEHQRRFLWSPEEDMMLIRVEKDIFKEFGLHKSTVSQLTIHFDLYQHTLMEMSGHLSVC